MKAYWMRRLMAFALMLVMTASLGAAAFADSYAADQSYVMDKSGERVFAVRVVSDEEPEALRDALLAEGYDAYLYENSGRTDVLCGKYRSGVEANAAWEEMRGELQDARVLMSTAWLPGDAVDAFEAGPIAEEKPAETEEPAEAEKPAAEEKKQAESKPEKTRKTCSLQDTEGTQVYTVALSASQDLSYAESLVAKMEKAGFDAFILQEGAGYRVMSGKFHDICNALLYRDCIWSNTDRTDTYIATVTVAQDEIDTFTEDYEKNGLPGKIKENLEKPTGAFYREKNGQVLAYTVQFSAGTSFSGSERNRDAMSAAGFPAFVYECSRIYEIMSGAFYNKADAEAWCQKIKDNTAESDAYVTTAWLPSKIVK